MTLSAETSFDLLETLRKMPQEQRDRLRSLVTPRIVEPYIAHIPHPKQQVFLTLNCREALYGGAAGGGKSDAILMAALQYVDVPGYSALILRRTWPDLNAPGAILDRAKTWLMGTDAQMKDGGRTFVFPSGAKLSFGYLQYDKDKFKFQSAEYQFIGFDELTHFEEAQYTYLFSRLRRPELVCLNCGNAVRKYRSNNGWQHTGRKAGARCNNVFPDPKVLTQYGPAPDGLSIFDVPLRMRGATNPGGIGHEWVKRDLVEPKTRKEGTVFIQAKLKDNPSLDQESYEESLSHLSLVDRQRLQDGDWDSTEAGDFFKRHWFAILSTPTHQDRVRQCRFWDLAGTEGGGDWTASALIAALPDGTFEIRDLFRGQWSGANIEKVIQQTAVTDGRYVPIRMEQEPGSAGKNIIDHYRRNVLPGMNFDGIRPTGSKEARAYPVKVAAEKGLIKIVVNNHTKDFLNEADAFPHGAHDDMVDAVSGAFGELSFGRSGRLLV